MSQLPCPGFPLVLSSQEDPSSSVDELNNPNPSSVLTHRHISPAKAVRQGMPTPRSKSKPRVGKVVITLATAATLQRVEEDSSAVSRLYHPHATQDPCRTPYTANRPAPSSRVQDDKAGRGRHGRHGSQKPPVAGSGARPPSPAPLSSASQKPGAAGTPQTTTVQMLSFSTTAPSTGLSTAQLENGTWGRPSTPSKPVPKATGTAAVEPPTTCTSPWQTTQNPCV